jgi:prepilin-type N-terminal cleavage/methylation domain-containing protein
MKPTQKGFSLIELLIVVAIILIIAAIAIPNLIASRLRAHEASAVGSMRAINSACQNYALTYGGFPLTLSALGPAAVASSSAADLIDITLASGTRSGYSFTYTPAAPAGGVINAYTVTANPTNQGITGQRGFFTDQSFVIRANSTAAASVTDPPIS